MPNTEFIALGRKIAAAADSLGLDLDVYAVLNLTNELLSLGVLPETPATVYGSWTAEELDAAYRNDAEAAQSMREGKRISAIKRVRQLSGASLLDAKNASETALNRELYPASFPNWAETR